MSDRHARHAAQRLPGPTAVAAAQEPVTPADSADQVARRLERLDEIVARAADRGAALVVMPEAFVPGYRWQPGNAEVADRARAGLLLAASRRGIHAAAGVVDPRGSTLVLAAPDGRSWTYRKRFPAVGEAAVWSAGCCAVLADTAVGRVGLLICADVLQPAAWRPLLGRVDLLAVAAAWPDYRGRLQRVPRLARPLLGPVARGSNLHRQVLLPRLARGLGAPVVFSNAWGPWRHAEGFAGGSVILDGDGAEQARAGDSEALIVATVRGAAPGPPPRQPVAWHAFNAVNRWAAHARGWMARGIV